jgi:hypothetical protein
VESTPDILNQMGNQEELSPTDSLFTDASLDDLEFLSDNSPVTSSNKAQLSFSDKRTPHTELAHIPVQVGITFFNKFISFTLGTFMGLSRNIFWAGNQVKDLCFREFLNFHYEGQLC